MKWTDGDSEPVGVLAVAVSIIVMLVLLAVLLGRCA